MGIMTAYIGLIHKDEDSAFGVSFPDMPGHITAGRTLDEAMDRAQELLGLLLDTWEEDSGEHAPEPSSLDALRADPAFTDSLKDGVVIAVQATPQPKRVAAE